MPLDYLYSTSQNINNKVQVAGGSTQYTDVLFNILANPTLIPNCKFVFDGPQVSKQVSIPLEIIPPKAPITDAPAPIHAPIITDSATLEYFLSLSNIRAK